MSDRPNCALCLKPVDEFDIREEYDGAVIVFVFKCHGQTEERRFSRIALSGGYETEPKKAFTQARPVSDEDADWIERCQHTFFELVGRGLIACEDRGEGFKRLDEPTSVWPFKLHSWKCERRRLARVGVRGRRVWRTASRLISERQAMDSLKPPLKVVTMRGHRIGKGVLIERPRVPRDMWPVVRRMATVYAPDGATIPQETRAYLEMLLERAVVRAAR